MEEKHSFVSNILLHSCPTPQKLQLLLSLVGVSPGAAFHNVVADVKFCFLWESIHPHDSCCLKPEALSLHMPPWPHPTHHVYQSLKYLMTEYANGQKWQLSPLICCCSILPSRYKSVWNNKTCRVLAPCWSFSFQICDFLEHSWDGSSHLGSHLFFFLGILPVSEGWGYVSSINEFRLL